MFDIEMTGDVTEWLRKLDDMIGRQMILVRIQRLRDGHFGDCKSVAGRIMELRIHSGPGYRVYFVREGNRLIVLLCGGVKSGQKRDIERAIRLDAERKGSS